MLPAELVLAIATLTAELSVPVLVVVEPEVEIDGCCVLLAYVDESRDSLYHINFNKGYRIQIVFLAFLLYIQYPCKSIQTFFQIFFDP